MGVPIAPSTWETYEWQAYTDGLTVAEGGGDDLRSLVQLPASYVIDDLWVAGERRDITVWLSTSGQRLALKIHHAMLTYRVAADRQSGSDGIISGVLATDDLVKAIKDTNGSSKLGCSTNIDNVLMQITGASDMMKDGTQSTAVCDGISIAIGFDAVASKLGQAVAPPPPPHSCQ